MAFHGVVEVKLMVVERCGGGSILGLGETTDLYVEGSLIRNIYFRNMQPHQSNK